MSFNWVWKMIKKFISRREIGWCAYVTVYRGTFAFEIGGSKFRGSMENFVGSFICVDCSQCSIHISFWSIDKWKRINSYQTSPLIIIEIINWQQIHHQNCTQEKTETKTEAKTLLFSFSVRLSLPEIALRIVVNKSKFQGISNKNEEL